MLIRTALRPLALLTLATVCLSGACSDDSADDTSAAEPGAEAVVARAVTLLGQEELVLDADLAERHLFVMYQVNGELDTASARCATAAFIESLGGREALADVRLAELIAEENNKAHRDAARSCEPEAIGPTTSVDPFAESPAEPLPADIDPVLLRDHLVTMTTAAGRTQGLTDAEATCFAEASYGVLDDRQIIAIQRPEAYPDVELPERDGTDEVLECFTAERIEELSEELRPAVEQRESAPQGS